MWERRLERTHWNDAYLLQNVKDQYAGCKDRTAYGNPLVWCRLDVIAVGIHRGYLLTLFYRQGYVSTRNKQFLTKPQVGAANAGQSIVPPSRR